MKNEFDSKAKEWDMNPIHLERSKAIAHAMKQHIPLTGTMQAMEFGGGTGLLSIELRDTVGSILLLDTSVEMVRIVNEKLSREGSGNITARCLDLEKEPFEGKFDLIFNQMVLHHVTDPIALFDKFNSYLNPGGFLAIADLYAEDGSFHDEQFTGHKGFDTNELEQQLRRKGFHKIQTLPVYTIKRPDANGQFAEYPVFLMIAEKE